jgi:hypothetical protein
MNMVDFMGNGAQAFLLENKLCAFCFWHTHDFPDDAEHRALHAAGWHSCSFDGEFRECNPDCQNFIVSPMVEASI